MAESKSYPIMKKEKDTRTGMSRRGFLKAAALTGTVASGSLSRLMDSIGGAFGLILGMTGSCALILLFSIVSAVSAVVSG